VPARAVPSGKALVEEKNRADSGLGSGTIGRWCEAVKGPGLAKLIAWALLTAFGAATGSAQELFPGALFPMGCPPNPMFNAPYWGGVVADLDQDGDADVAASSDSAGLAVCKSSGGTPGPVTCHPAATALGRMAAGDLDGDGDQDIVASSLTGGSVFTFLNDGTGAFGPGVLTAAGGPGNEVTIGRVGADTIPDVLVVSLNHPVQVLSGTGLGTFAPAVAGPIIAGAIHAVHDDDGDGDLDLHEVFASSLFTYRNTGPGGFTAPILRCSFAPFSPPGGSIAFGDLDGDGNQDAALVANGAAGAFIEVALGNAAGALSPGGPQILGPTFPVAWVSLADFDGDGDRDLLAASPWNGAFYASNSLGAFSAAAFLTRAAIGSIATGDLSADARADALFFTSLGAAALRRGHGGTGLANETTIPVPPNGTDFLITDLDANGLPDAVVSFHQYNTTGPPTSGVAVHLDVGAGLPASQTVVTGTNAQITDLTTCDWNRDGVVDMVALDQQNTVRVLLGTPSGTLMPPISFPLGLFSWNKLIAADVNQDGITDLIVGDASTITVRFGDGLGGIGSVVSSPICPIPGIASCTLPPCIEAADVNQDGLLDLVALFGGSASATGPNVYIGNGAGSFAYASTVCCGAGAYPLSLIVRDMNLDHVVDVVFSVPAPSSGPSGVQVALGLGAGAFGPAVTFPIPTGPAGPTLIGYPIPAAGDLDGNGFPDLVFPGGAVMLNDGAGGLFLHEVVSVFGSMRVAIADFDLDLQQDLAFFGPTIGAGWLTLVRNTTTCSAIGGPYGLGCPGSGGFVPVLEVFGCASPGGAITLRVSHALGGSPAAALVVGPAAASVPVGFGCSAHVLLTGSIIVPFALGGFPGSGLGAGSVPVTVPPGIAPGTSVAVQAAILDAGSPFGWSATNGFALVIQ
jgi:FG-GAP-like repeat